MSGDTFRWLFGVTLTACVRLPIAYPVTDFWNAARFGGNHLPSIYFWGTQGTRDKDR